jgi:hypothetical protein
MFRKSANAVVPAKAGTRLFLKPGSRLRGNDNLSLLP